MHSTYNLESLDHTITKLKRIVLGILYEVDEQIKKNSRTNKLVTV